MIRGVSFGVVWCRFPPNAESGCDLEVTMVVDSKDGIHTGRLLLVQVTVCATANH